MVFLAQVGLINILQLSSIALTQQSAGIRKQNAKIMYWDINAEWWYRYLMQMMGWIVLSWWGQVCRCWGATGVRSLCWNMNVSLCLAYIFIGHDMVRWYESTCTNLPYRNKTLYNIHSVWILNTRVNGCILQLQIVRAITYSCLWYSYYF